MDVDKLLPSDEVTFVGKPQTTINCLSDLFEIPVDPVNSVLLIGGSITALMTLFNSTIKGEVQTTIIEKDLKKCEILSN